VNPDEAIVRRIRTRSIVIAVAMSVAAFGLDWRSGVSLTICAAVVIFSFLIFEKLTDRIGTRHRKGVRGSLVLLLVTIGAGALLVVALRWKSFVPLAGFLGLSAVVVAIVAEIFERSR
jgi:uncharacterized membrane protein YidH (DUF202 family)